MLDQESLFKYVVTAGGGVIAYFVKAFHRGIKDQEKKVERLGNKISQVENKLEIIDTQTSSKIDKLEQLSKIQFDQLHMEISDLKSNINSIDDNIKELIRSSR